MRFLLSLTIVLMSMSSFSKSKPCYLKINTRDMDDLAEPSGLKRIEVYVDGKLNFAYRFSTYNNRKATVKRLKQLGCNIEVPGTKVSKTATCRIAAHAYGGRVNAIVMADPNNDLNSSTLFVSFGAHPNDVLEDEIDQMVNDGVCSRKIY